MNKYNAKAFIPIVTALAEGKTIQFQTKEGGDTWINVSEISFLYDLHRYRVKPEPVITNGYRRYISYSQEFNTNYVRIVTEITKGRHEETVQNIEKDQCFIRWIDEEWVYEKV